MATIIIHRHIATGVIQGQANSGGIIGATTIMVVYRYADYRYQQASGKQECRYLL